MTWVMITLFLGVVGAILAFFKDYAMIAVLMGAAGMVVGGFSFSVVYRFPGSDKNKIMYMAIAGAGLMLSVVAFMIGLANWLG